MSKKSWSLVVPLVLLGGALGAQEKEKAETSRKQPTPLKLQVLFTRYQGEKKVSSVPYTLSINADDRPTRLRMGIQVPIRVTAGETSQVQYKDVGNNLDCNAEALSDGRFRVGCALEQSSVYSAEGEAAAGSAVSRVSLASVPLFRTFRSETNLLLRDGQSALYTAATDPVSGEVLKIELTLNVVK